MIAPNQITGVLGALASNGISASTFFISLLQNQYFPASATNDLVANLSQILTALLAHPNVNQPVLQWAGTVFTQKVARSIADLSKVENGWHFGAANVSAEQLADFRVEELAQDMECMAPELWHFLDVLLSANTKLAASNARGPDTLDDEKDEYWAQLDESMADEGGTTGGARNHLHLALVKIV